MTTLADRLRLSREARGLTQDELAEETELNRVTVAKYELGMSKPGADALAKISSVLHVSADELLFGMTQKKATVQSVRIPVLGTIPAGIPIEAIEDILDWEEIPADWTRGGKEYFALRVSGDSMYPRYEDGDVIILRKTDTCSSGQDCAVMVNGGDATFKRVRYDRGATMLVPINPEYETYVYSAEQVQSLPVRILGVVVELRRKVKT